MIHKLELETKNFHGSFNNGYEPILTIDSGDSIQLKTLDILGARRNHYDR